MHRPVPTAKSVRSDFAICLLAILLTTGCRHASRDEYRTALPEDLSTVHPDDRREAIVDIAKSHNYDNDTSFSVLDAVARTDPEAQIRCIALRSLAEYDDARPIETFMMILTAQDRQDGSLPANDDVRWEAVIGVVSMVKRGLVPEAQIGTVRQLLVDRMQTDPMRNVRITAIEGTGYIRDPLVFGPLIEQLRDEDFAIANEAESALIRQTGITHHYDPKAWEQWLANTNDPFARAGEIPEGLEREGPGFWDLQKREWRRRLKLGPED